LLSPCKQQGNVRPQSSRRYW